MNTKTLIGAAAIFAAAGSAFAQQTYPYVDFRGIESTRSRAEVMQELAASRASGERIAGQREFVEPAAGFVSSMTREQVAAELQRSKADGSYALAHQQYEGQFRVPANGADGGIRLARSGAATGTN